MIGDFAANIHTCPSWRHFKYNGCSEVCKMAQCENQSRLQVGGSILY